MIDYLIFKTAFGSLFFLLAIFSMFMVSSSVEILTTSQFLTGSMTIVSNQEEFEMGFISPENSGKWFLAIWYKSISVPTVVWIANRDAPLNDTSAILRVTQRGNLTLSLNSSNNIVWSSSHSANVQNPITQLLDNGNLVVRDANDADPLNYLWQSFDFPTDTLLPGAKLGKSFVTGINRVLNSWKSNSDPSRGNYTFEFDTHGYPQLFLMINGTTPRGRPGPWNGIRFSGMQSLKPNPLNTFHYAFSQEEVYYSFELVNKAVKSRTVLQQDGILRRLTWNNGTKRWITLLSGPTDDCESYGLCYGNGICNMANSPVCGCLDKFVPKSKKNWDKADWSGGCVRRTLLDCQKGDGFLRYENIKLPDTRNSWYNVTMTLRECRRICSRNCSCMAYSDLNITNGGSGCLLWFGDLKDMRQWPEGGQDIYIRLASSEVAGSKWTARKKIAVSLAVLVGAVLLGLVLGLFCSLRARNNRRKHQELELLQLQGLPHIIGQSQTNRCQKEDLELPLFSLEKIAIATNNFSHENKIGEGGFGPVYKGVLEDGQEIAVKRLSKHSAQGTDEFKNEVIFISKLQHRNLVRLLGCCIQGEEKLLVYEYMLNNSLDTFIFDEMRCTLLDWSKRFNIINGIARGLLYLHQDSRLRIIHRDLKAANVLLDNDMNPKISDFGMARSFGGNDSEANTKRVVGTFGYMPPEYTVDGIFSVKSDVFSFGVLVLEIISGKKNRGFYDANHHHNLLGHAWLLYQEGRSVELINDYLAESCHLIEVQRSIHVSLLCVQQNPEDRPSMPAVILMLASEGPLAPPKEPGFFTDRNVCFNPPDSNNEISITLLDGR